MKTIEITFNPDGSTMIEAKGFNGVGCQDATKAIEEALGVVTDRKKKPEYFSQVSSQNKAKLERGW